MPGPVPFSPQLTTRSVSGATTVAANEFVVADAAAGGYTITGPAASTSRRWGVKKTDATSNVVTISYTNAAGSAATITLTVPDDAKTFEALGAGYVAVGSDRSRTQDDQRYTRLGATGAFRKTLDLRAALAPLAPRGRRVQSSPPTVAISGTNPTTANHPVALDDNNQSPVGHSRLTVLAGADWKQNATGAGWAANQNSASLDAITKSPGSVMVGTDTTQLTFHVHSWGGHIYRLRVDYGDGLGWQYITDINSTSGPANGSAQYLSITFPDNSPKTVRMDWSNGDLRGLWTASTSDTVWAPKPVGPRVAVVGDSYAGGAGSAPTGYNALGSFVWSMADFLGWDDVVNAGVGGSGFIAASNNFQARTSRIIGWNPDIVIFAGGHNDQGQTAAAIQTAADVTFSAVRAGLPNALLITAGPFQAGDPIDGSSNSTYAPVQAAIFAAAAASRVATIDTVASGIFTGTGKAGTAGTGNGNTYMQADSTHPTQIGANYLGRRMAEKVLQLLSAA